VSETETSPPLPPAELIERVVGCFSNDRVEESREHFLSTGRHSLGDLDTALAAVSDTLSAHERILEFGCGCGRIMRWMEDLAEDRTLVGTDIDVRAVEWASENLPFARFDVNDALPPTRYSDGEFDLVINHSVFTHLDAGYQDLWLAELQRITAPGAVLVLTVHGDHGFRVAEQQLEPGSNEAREWRERLQRDGILYIAEDSYVGSAFPDFYHTTFHAPWYVLEHWSRWFEVLAYLPRSSLDFQDQVVLRRRASEDVVEVPIKARPQGQIAPEPDRSSGSTPLLPDPLKAPMSPSRFGSVGLLARRVLFRAMRPVLHAQREVDISLDARVSAVDARMRERMPPLVHLALRKQAERIDRLEGELRGLRRTLDNR
jgi:SAM-dependent methyltransferase